MWPGVRSDIAVNETTPIAIRDSTSVRGIKMHPQLLSSVRPYSVLAMHIPATVARNGGRLAVLVPARPKALVPKENKIVVSKGSV